MADDKTVDPTDEQAIADEIAAMQELPEVKVLPSGPATQAALRAIAVLHLADDDDDDDDDAPEASTSAV